MIERSNDVLMLCFLFFFIDGNIEYGMIELWNDWIINWLNNAMIAVGVIDWLNDGIMK